MKKITFIFVATICVLCIASCTKIQESDKTEEIDKWAYIYEIENFGYGDSSEIDWSPYENPYEYDVFESPEAGLYFDLDSNGAIAMCKAAKELSEKGWENIVTYRGFPTENFNDANFCLYKQERELFIDTVHATTNGGTNEAVVIIGMSKDYPDGEIIRVQYSAGGRTFNHVNKGFKRNEIIDAYTTNFWEIAYSY